MIESGNTVTWPLSKPGIETRFDASSGHINRYAFWIVTSNYMSSVARWYET